MPDKAERHKNYFNSDTEAAIVRFQQEECAENRKRIFVDEIKQSFDKLVENIIFVYEFHEIGNLSILKNDCVSFLFENLSKFNATKGHKAFSYFNVVAKNWFIQRVKVHRKRNRTDVNFDKDLLTQLEKSSDKVIVAPYEDLVLSHEFYSLLKSDIADWYKKFTKPHERKVLSAVVLLLENPDLPTIYNKKGIYLYIREITNLNTKQIATNLAKFRRRYLMFKKRYEAGKL